MRSVMFIIPILALAINAFGITTTIGPTNPPQEGFHSIMWGTDVSKISEFRFIKKDRNTDFYKKTKENLLYESAALDSVTYEAFNGKLFLVSAEFSGNKNYELLQKRFKQRFSDYSTMESKHGYNKDINFSWYFYDFGSNQAQHTMTVRIEYNFTTKKGEFRWSHMKYAAPISF